jgi:hypothetical protein
MDIIGDGFDLMIAHPPCTYLAVSGMHWTTRGMRDPQLTEDALDFVRRLMAAPIPRIAIENPVSVISSRIRKPDQIIQPMDFGHKEPKKTCLWIKGLPKLKATHTGIQPEYTITKSGKRMATWYYYADNTKKSNRSIVRSKTFRGIAEAMARQWGNL